MSTPVSLRLMNCAKIGRQNSLIQILNVLQAVGIRPALLEVGSLAYEQFAFWRNYDDRARRELNVAYDKRQLTFRTADDRSHTTLTFDINWSLDDAGEPIHGLLQATAFHTLEFTRSEHNPELHAERLLEVSMVLYDLIRPAFGWIERCHPSGYTNWSDTNNLLLPHIYWANFFGPEYVNKFGREFLLKAPGWKSEQLVDGGILYVLSPSLAGTGPKALVEEVKNYFHIDSVRRRVKK